jgi:hypothetical protein
VQLPEKRTLVPAVVSTGLLGSRRLGLAAAALIETATRLKRPTAMTNDIAAHAAGRQGAGEDQMVLQ